jgi:hypothetical protein
MGAAGAGCQGVCWRPGKKVIIGERGFMEEVAQAQCGVVVCEAGAQSSGAHSRKAGWVREQVPANEEVSLKLQLGEGERVE